MKTKIDPNKPIPFVPIKAVPPNSTPVVRASIRYADAKRRRDIQASVRKAA